MWRGLWCVRGPWCWGVCGVGVHGVGGIKGGGVLHDNDNDDADVTP